MIRKYKRRSTLYKLSETDFSKVFNLGGGGGGVTSTHNKRGCAILTKKVAPKNLKVT